MLKNLLYQYSLHLSEFPPLFLLASPLLHSLSLWQAVHADVPAYYMINYQQLIMEKNTAARTHGSYVLIQGLGLNRMAFNHIS